MAPYDDWNRLDEEEDEELQDTSVSVHHISSNDKVELSCQVLRRKERCYIIRYRLLRVNA